MNTKSINFRLTLWYFLAFLISSAAIFSAFFYITRQTLLSQTDKEINIHGQQITSVVQKMAIDATQAFPKSQLNQQFTQMPGMLVLVIDKKGEVLTSSQSISSGSEKSVINNILTIVNNSSTVVFLSINFGATPMRVGIFPSNNGGSTNYILVGHPLDVIQNSLINLTKELLIVFLATALLSIIGGFFIAKRALFPLSIFTQEMNKISTQNLTTEIRTMKTGDELEKLSKSFNALLTRMKDSFTRERQFIGDVAHELKTPLSIIKSNLEISLENDRTLNEYKNTISESLVDINNLSATINEILDLAWLGSDKHLEKPELVDLSKIALEIDELAHQMAVIKKLHIVEEIQPGINISGNKRLLFRAVFNLLDNAIKYTPDNGRIAISLLKNEGQAVLEISNTGPGIIALDLPHVFDRFYKGQSADTEHGVGLGLAICKSIVEAHHGLVEIRSEPQKITTVKIVLPILMIS